MKVRMRREVKEKRLALEKHERLVYALDASKKLFDTAQWKEAKAILSYMDFMGELGTEEINKRVIAEGKVLLLPKTTANTHIMRSIVVENIGDYQIGEYGIREPRGEVEGEPDLVIVPGVAFDKAGNRIGYGGGYYDRYLQGRSCHKVALIYDFQLYDNIDAEEHDIPMDRLIVAENNR